MRKFLLATVVAIGALAATPTLAQTPAPVFNSSICDQEDVTLVAGLTAIIKAAEDFIKAGGDTSNRPAGWIAQQMDDYTNSHRGQACKAAKAAHTAAWMQWWNAATPETREAQATRAQNQCSAAYPIKCSKGF